MTRTQLETEGYRPLIKDRQITTPWRTEVEFAREQPVFPGRTKPWRGVFEELPPDFNVAGLWWREVK